MHCLIAVFTGIILVMQAGIAFSQENRSQSVTGNWISEEEDSRIEIYKKGEKVFGRIAALKNEYFTPAESKKLAGTLKRDIKNPDPSNREHPLKGLEIIKNFSPGADSAWENGTIYDPNSGTTYNCKMWVDKNGFLNIHGYIGISLIGKTTKWQSAESYFNKILLFLGKK